MSVLDMVLGRLDATSVIIFLVVFLIGYHWLTTPRNLPPGPTGLPVVGNMFSMKRALPNIKGLLKKWRQQYGDVYTIRMGNKYLVVINSNELLQEAFVRQGEVFSGRPTVLYVLRKVIEVTGSGIVNTNGPAWKEIRRITLMTMRDFGVGKKSLEQRVQEEARAIVDVLDEGQPVAMKPLISKFSANVICSVTLGNRFDYEDAAFNKLTEIVSRFASQQGVFNPANFVSIMRFVPSVRKVIDSIVNCFVDLDNYLEMILKDHETTYDPNEIRDFVDLYIKTREETKNTHVFSVGNMRRVIIDLLCAGTETTATTIDWIILYLIVHPDVQKRCQEDVDRVIGHGRMPTMEDREDLPYINAVISETLRCVTIAPLGIPHMTLGEGEVGGYKLPADTIVVANFEEIHHDPAFWPEPYAFKPERFLDKDGRFFLPKENFIPFSLGPRACLGEVFARMELFILFTTLMQSFTFTMTKGRDPVLEGHLGITYAALEQPVLAVRR